VATQLNSSLLTISVIAVLLPAAFHFTIGNQQQQLDPDEGSDILHVSHGVSTVVHSREPRSSLLVDSSHSPFQFVIVSKLRFLN
jgi:hypothetical protein